MTNYLLLKYMHISCAVISITLFILRGLLSFRGSGLMQQRWLKILPHVIDTVLLSSALALTMILQQYPFTDGWLTAKFFGVVVYILLGSVALKQCKTKTQRIGAWIAALIVFAYIVLVALNHNPLPNI